MIRTRTRREPSQTVGLVKDLEGWLAENGLEADYRFYDRRKRMSIRAKWVPTALAIADYARTTMTETIVADDIPLDRIEILAVDGGQAFSFRLWPHDFAESRHNNSTV